MHIGETVLFFVLGFFCFFFSVLHLLKEENIPGKTLLICWTTRVTPSYVFMFPETPSVDLSQKHLEQTRVDVVHWRGCGRPKKWGNRGRKAS